MTSFALKLIAMAPMLIDHSGYVFYAHPGMPTELYIVCRLIGRCAMPLYCFLIAEGLFHTRDVRKYLLRMALFALISELPFDLMVSGEWLDWGQQNVGVTLFLALLGILLYDTFAARGRKLAALGSIVAAGLLAQLLRGDYGLYGVFWVFVFYYFRGASALAKTLGLLAGIVAQALSLWLDGSQRMALISLASVSAMLPIAHYNGRPGPRSALNRSLLYLFYPLHMLLLHVLAQL